jgi:hypothetical protein
MISCSLIVDVTVPSVRDTLRVPNSDVREDGTQGDNVVQSNVTAGRSCSGWSVGERQMQCGSCSTYN